MTVAELIEHLQWCDPTATVLVSAYEYDLTLAQEPQSITACHLQGDDAPEGQWGGDYKAAPHGSLVVYIAGERHDRK